MSLENEISQLTKSINELNANFERFFNAQSAPTPQAQATPQPPVEPEPEQETFLPEVAKEAPSMTRESLQAFCLEAVKRNAANRDIIKSIMLNNFEARKTGDLADNQINLCYSMIAEATKD